LAADGRADKWLVDPPREVLSRSPRRADLCSADAAAPGWLPRRIVYVSCNPATLARDAGLLVHQAGYVCSAAAAVNMFAHTAHVESIAVFDLAEGALSTGGGVMAPYRRRGPEGPRR
jgi:23S rRNA (uracil1939-C5)-methyltransferase